MTISENSEFKMKLKSTFMRAVTAANVHAPEIIMGVGTIYTVMHEQGYTDEQFVDFICNDCRWKAEHAKEG